MPISRNINIIMIGDRGQNFGHHETATETESRRRRGEQEPQTPISSPRPLLTAVQKKGILQPSAHDSNNNTIKHHSRNERRTRTTPPHRIYLPKLANIPTVKEELLTSFFKKGAREPIDVERTKGERFPYPSVSFLVIAASFLARATLRLWSEFVTFGSRHGAGWGGRL